MALYDQLIPEMRGGPLVDENGYGGGDEVCAWGLH
jgi:hypothetical protein